MPRNHTATLAAWLLLSCTTEHPVLHKMGRCCVGSQGSQNGHFVTTEAVIANLQNNSAPSHTFSFPQGLFHPARKVREVYWKIYNMLYIGSEVRLNSDLILIYILKSNTERYPNMAISLLWVM